MAQILPQEEKQFGAQHPESVRTRGTLALARALLSRRDGKTDETKKKAHAKSLKASLAEAVEVSCRSVILAGALIPFER